MIATLNGKAHNFGQPATSVTFVPGRDTFALRFQGKAITVTPTWALVEQVRNRVDLKAGLDGLLKVGEFSVKVPGLGEPSFGPLYQESFHVADTTLQSLFDQISFLGTQTVPLPAFTIGNNFTLSTAVTSFTNSAAQGSGSLRFAIASTNLLASPAPVVIELGTGTYTLTLPRTGIADGASGNLVLTAPDVTIVGQGAGQTTINAAGLGDRIFRVMNGARVKLVGLTLTGGIARNLSDAPGTYAHGGGVLQDAGTTLEIDGCVITNNQATTLGAEFTGGTGIFSRGGTLTVTDSTISNNSTGTRPNHAFGGGVGIAGGTAVFRRTTISGNTVMATLGGIGGVAPGGGMWVGAGAVRIEESTISDNTADGAGGWGAGLYVCTSFATGVPSTYVLLDRTTIYRNRGVGGQAWGGGVFVLPGGARCISPSSGARWPATRRPPRTASGPGTPRHPGSTRSASSTRSS